MDDDLIDDARSGDPEAVRRLYERHAARVYAIVRRLSGDDATAEDLAQEAWIRIFRALPGFRGEARIGTWLHRIAVNAALSGRRRQRLRTSIVHVMSEVPEPAARADRPLLRLDLERAIDELPQGMRRVLVLHDVEGYKHHEIAEILGVSPGTCKSQLFKARARLRALLEPETVRIEGEEAWSI